MGLYNPILGNIPEPKKNSEEVYNPKFPTSNYKAQVVTPLVTELFIETLETSNTQTDTYTTTKDIILTQIIIQGYFERPNSSVTGTVDIYINELKIYSINTSLTYDAVYTENNKIQYFNANIPIQQCLINSNSKLIMISARTNGTLIMNASFIGYYYTKQ